MRFTSRFNRLFAGFFALALLVGVSGQDCVPGGLPLPTTDVTVELVNVTDLPVDPGIYADPRIGVVTSDELITDENFVLIDPPIQPLETVTLTFACEDIGTIVSDYAFQILNDTEIVISEDRPILIYDEDFVCGDVIRFIFDETAEGLFVTDVEVNGVLVYPPPL